MVPSKVGPCRRLLGANITGSAGAGVPHPLPVIVRGEERCAVLLSGEPACPGSQCTLIPGPGMPTHKTERIPELGEPWPK